MATKTRSRTRSTSSDKPKDVQPETVPVPEPESRSMGRVNVHMKLDDTHEWNFKEKSAFDAILRGQWICKKNGFRWPQDVVEWDFS